MRLFLLQGFVLFSLFLPSLSKAGRVRSLGTDESRMNTIYLSMGQSTILRFQDKPQKAIVGNQNYFNIEFVGNDVAIQPLSATQTNLFIYCDYGRVYGFILKVGSSKRYDDRVDVKWRSLSKIRLEKPRPKKKVRPISLVLGKVLRARLLGVSKNEALKLYFVDLEIENRSKKKLSLASLKAFVTRSGKKLFDQKFVLKDESLEAGKKTQLRFILKLKKKKAFSLNLQFEKNKAKAIVSRTKL